MALLECSYFSDVMGMHRTMRVIMPQRTLRNMDVVGVDEEGNFPVLYLLHGLGDDQNRWTNCSSIEAYAKAYNLAIVMPCADRSFYCDMVNGPRYFTHIADEVPRICQKMFRISRKRDHNFLAGVSMGGHGAFKIALRRPKKFAAAASLAGVLSLTVPEEHDWQAIPNEHELIFGSDSVAGTENDITHLAQTLDAEEGPKPKLYAWCGTEDFLYEGNQVFRKSMAKTSLDFEYDEGPGDHQWVYWNQEIRKVLDWLPLPETP
ncbi:hypothetical protein BVY04_03555 [bacterium M21]|nr:hypothetical protein BVY04_03555 [bacterium M21]